MNKRAILIFVFMCFFVMNVKSEIRPNIILLSVDAMRPDHMSSYGYHRNTTPNIDKIAKNGVIFRDVSTSVPLTNPSMSILFTSQPPSQTGVKRNGIPLKSDVDTLIKILKTNGYKTLASVSSYALYHSRSGLNRDFDVYRDQGLETELELDASLVTARALEILDQDFSGPFFLWVHFIEPHQPHKEYKGFTFKEKKGYRNKRVKLIDAYDSELAYVDHHIGIILDNLKAKGVLDNSLVLIMADHGESLNENDRIYTGHGRRLYQTILRIPFIISGPGIPVAKEIKALVHISDITPTLLSYLELYPTKDMIGRNLLPVIYKDREIDDNPMFFETYSFMVFNFPLLNKIWEKSKPVVVGMRLGDIKVVYNLRKGEWQLYNLREDPKEKINLFDKDKPEIKQIANQLHDWYEKDKHHKNVIPSF